MIVIGLIGYKGVGKTTACNLIKKNFSHLNIVQHNFKDALIAELKQNFPNLLEELRLIYKCETIDELFIVKPPAVRYLMQHYGTEVRRGDNPKYWTLLWIENMPTADIVLVDDVRFMNEANAVKSKDGILVRLVRGDLINDDRHASEIEQESIVTDRTIVTCIDEISKLEKHLASIVEFKL